MSDDDHQIEENSDIPPLVVPTFSSKIPPHLLRGASEEAQYILQELSLQSEYLRYIIPVLVATHGEVRRTNGKVKKLQAFRNALMSWKMMLVATISTLGGLIGTAIAIYKVFHP